MIRRILSIILTACLLQLCLTTQVSYSQIQLGRDTAELIIKSQQAGLYYKSLSTLQELLIKELTDKNTRQDSLIMSLYNNLQVELNKPVEYKTDWKLVGMYCGFTACIISLICLLITIKK